MATVENEKPSQRIITSGKVYRQIFDAEVQLVRSLEKSKTAKHGTITQNAGHKRTGIPVVHMKLPTAGMLDDRQIRWLEEFPNEPYTENPIVYKFYSEEVRNRLRESEASLDEKEVCGLPDVIVPAKVGSNVIERIAASRKQRHEATLEDMYHELGLISTQIEPEVASLGEHVMNDLRENDVLIENIMLEIMPDEALWTLPMSRLISVWEKVAVQTSVRRGFITDLDTKMGQLEKLRMEKVKKVFEDTSSTLEKIGYLVLPDLQRLLDKECQVINQTVLANKRAYADLYARLMLSAVEKEKKAYLQWTTQVEHWRQIHEDDVVKRFVSFMSGEDIVNPSSVQKILDELITKQKSLNQRRVELVVSLRDLQPPLSTKTAVAEWHQQILEISKDIDFTNQKYFSELCAEYERICQSCLKEVDKVKKELIERSVCTSGRAGEIIQTQCLPLVGEQQAKYEKFMEEMDKSLEEQSATVLGRLKNLFKFCQQVGHRWDLHEIGLAKREKELKEKLEEVRLLNEITNQESEANLDALLDQLRQGATESALHDNLRKARDLLGAIRERYEEFHDEQSEVLAKYPEVIQTELSAYEKNVFSLFAVERKVEDDKKETETEEAGDVLMDAKVVKTKKGTVYFVVADKTAASVTSSRDATPQQLVTQRSDNELLDSSSVHLDEEESIFSFREVQREVKDLASYVQFTDVGDEMVQEIVVQIRMNILNHLDVWMEEAIERSKVVVEAKNSELQKELDLRIRLHEPRATRVELDIHNVRAAELVMHSERVLRHCKGVEQTISELRLKYATVTEDHNKMAEKFTKDVERLEAVFLNATKSSKLTELSHQLTVLQEKFMDEIRTSIRQFGQLLDRNIQMLHQSTAQLIKSFKLFSDGGNFCPAEVDEFRGKLSKLSTKIDQCEGSIMGNLESIEAKRFDQTLKVTRDFEDRYKYHMVDLVFMEKIARWLTNTKVKIKAEVAASNGAAKSVADALARFEQRLDACERPNPDKEPVVPGSLVTDLVPIYEAVEKRSVYLQCLKDPLPPSVTSSSSVSTMQGSPALGGRVAFTAEGLNCISRPGKHQLDDPSITVIKNILKTQKVPGSEGSSNDGQECSSANSGKLKKKNLKDAQKKPRLMSGKGKIDKKYFVFGEEAEEGEENNFQGRIKQILRVTLEALLAISELYYRQKGIRPVTRPEVLRESFDDCAEVLVQKCQFYSSQSDDYHNECLQEFRQQLSRLETLASRVPPAILNSLEHHALKQLQVELNQAEEEFAGKAEDSHRIMESHEQDLRPSLGHPQKLDELEDLCQRELERQQASLSAVDQHAQMLKDIVQRNAESFLQDLARTSENLFIQFDNMLVIDEVLSGRQATVKLSTTELIRRHKDGKPLESKISLVEVTRGRNTWPGIPTQEIISEPVSSSAVSVTSKKVKRGSAELRTASVTTAKTTLGHTSTVSTRDAAYEQYKSYILSTVVMINDDMEKRTTAEERWVEKWKTAVEKVKQLYQ